MTEDTEARIRIEGDNLYISLSGRFDTLRAMKMDDRLSELPDEICNICFDLKDLEYISSAGLRILYWSRKYTSKRNGILQISNVSPEVRETIAVTGFDQLIDIDGEGADPFDNED